MSAMRRINKTARVFAIILIPGLLAGMAGVFENGWQHPGHTIGQQFGWQ